MSTVQRFKGERAYDKVILRRRNRQFTRKRNIAKTLAQNGIINGLVCAKSQRFAWYIINEISEKGVRERCKCFSSVETTIEGGTRVFGKRLTDKVHRRIVIKVAMTFTTCQKTA